MPKALILGFVAALLLLAANLALAQTPAFQPNPYVYRIVVDGCKHAPANRRQTGFRVRGEAGIVTALHGVADCPNAIIKAEYPDGVFNGLTLTAVDIDRDVALLSSTEVATDTAAGLVAPRTDNVSREGLYALGYPYGKTFQEPTTQITVTYAMPLNRIIPGEFLTAAFIDRRSPDLYIRTLFAEAHFVPGHSGSPVLNAQDQVIGIVDGGLKEGYIGKSWLIPWVDVDLQSVDDNKIKERLNELITKDVAALAFSSTYPNQVYNDTQLQPLIRVNISICYSWDCRSAELSALLFGRTSTVPLSQTGSSDNGFTPDNRLCKFSFLVLDSETELPVNRASVTVLLGDKRKTGNTLGDGSFESSIPCPESNPSVEVYVNAGNYKPNSQRVTLVGNIEKVYLAPLILSTTTTQFPTPTPQFAITFTPTSTSIYPCEAEIVSSTSARSVNTLRAKPSVTSPSRGALDVGTKVRVTQKAEGATIWYRITQMNDSSLGWIPAENLHLSATCPK